MWVFMVLHTQFERLLQMVSERRRDGRLFYRVKSDGRPLDLQLVERILDGASTSSPACFNNAVGPAHLVREARSSDEPAPFYRPSSNSNVAPPPPFLGLAQQNVSVALSSKTISLHYSSIPFLPVLYRSLDYSMIVSLNSISITVRVCTLNLVLIRIQYVLYIVYNMYFRQVANSVNTVQCTFFVCSRPADGPPEIERYRCD